MELPELSENVRIESILTNYYCNVLFIITKYDTKLYEAELMMEFQTMPPSNVSQLYARSIFVILRTFRYMKFCICAICTIYYS